MDGARFEVAMRERNDGYGSRGADAVEFLITRTLASLRPLREVASGGELSRVMLALLSVAHGGGGKESGGARSKGRGGRKSVGGLPMGGGGDGALLVFDEVDAGIGGHTARAVGAHLPRARRGAPDPLHYAPAAGRSDGEQPFHHCQGRVPFAARDHCHSAGGRTLWSVSWCECSVPTLMTARPVGMHASSSKPPSGCETAQCPRTGSRWSAPCWSSNCNDYRDRPYGRYPYVHAVAASCP